MQIKTKRRELQLQLAFALAKTCEFQGYDKNQLLESLNLESVVIYNSSIKKGEIIKPFNERVPSLIINGGLEQFKFIQEIFVDQKLLIKKTGFYKLFNNPDKALAIQFNVGRADMILQLFTYLKSTKMISYSNCRSIYDVFRFHILDFEDKFLKGKPPRERMNVLKNSKAKWAANQRLIENWFTNLN
ncbi:MAG: hypothetical protein IPK31_07175 [Chitinophagaceae bacterium]|nr:hypothetical protein [Chitinophagaceae bacterium]